MKLFPQKLFLRKETKLKKKRYTQNIKTLSCKTQNLKTETEKNRGDVTCSVSSMNPFELQILMSSEEEEQERNQKQTRSWNDPSNPSRLLRSDHLQLALGLCNRRFLCGAKKNVNCQLKEIFISTQNLSSFASCSTGIQNHRSSP